MNDETGRRADAITKNTEEAMRIEQTGQLIAKALALAGALWPTLRLAADGAPAPSAEVGINVKTNDNREEQP